MNDWPMSNNNNLVYISRLFSGILNAVYFHFKVFLAVFTFDLILIILKVPHYSMSCTQIFYAEMCYLWEVFGDIFLIHLYYYVLIILVNYCWYVFCSGFNESFLEGQKGLLFFSYNMWALCCSYESSISLLFNSVFLLYFEEINIINPAVLIMVIYINFIYYSFPSNNGIF